MTVNAARIPDFPRRNNIQWLRLIFALQVALSHTRVHLGLWDGYLLPALFGRIPGVPAFYFISGFLIYDAWQRSSTQKYFLNRFLRLFPGLVFATLGGLFVIYVALGLQAMIDNWTLIAGWFVAQITIGQAFNPSEYRGIGVGVINGSLPTITVEIIFYCCVPLIASLERFGRYVMPGFILASLAVYLIGPTYLNQTVSGSNTIYDFLSITPIVWGWMFGVGMLAAKYFDRFSPRLGQMALVAVCCMILMAVWGGGILFYSTGNRLGVIYFLCYCVLILFIAFRTPFRDLKTDLSYGIYLWHMPIINLLIVINLPYASFVTIPAAVIVAWVSWHIVEKPVLDLKHKKK